MSNRGSLRHCILYVAEQLDKGHYEFYGIMHNPRGKYYTAYSPTELDEKEPNKDTDHLRLVFLGTKKELASFCKYEQRDLFNEEEDVEP